MHPSEHRGNKRTSHCEATKLNDIALVALGEWKTRNRERWADLQLHSLYSIYLSAPPRPAP